MSTADAKSTLVELWDRAHAHAQPGPLVERLDNAPAPPGFAVWRVGGLSGSVTALPALDPRAPFEVHRRYLQRVIATATGRCPECSAVAAISADPERTPAAWRVLPVTIGLQHATGCPATFDDSDKHWFPVFR